MTLPSVHLLRTVQKKDVSGPTFSGNIFMKCPAILVVYLLHRPFDSHNETYPLFHAIETDPSRPMKAWARGDYRRQRK